MWERQTRISPFVGEESPQYSRRSIGELLPSLPESTPAESAPTSSLVPGPSRGTHRFRRGDSTATQLLEECGCSDLHLHEYG